MFAIIDIETCGGKFEPQRGRITEICILIHDGLQVTEKFSTLSVSVFKVCCSFGVDDVGLIAIRKTNSLLLVNPPTIPPAWFVKVLPDLSSMESLNN